MVRMIRFLPLAALLAVSPVLAAAKEPPSQIAVPDQPWYPPGYRDLRVAAEGMVRAFPRDQVAVLHDWDDDGVGGYDVVDCMLGYDLPDNADWQAHLRELLALDVARMRVELARIGYRPEVYEAALLKHERASLAQLPSVPRPPPPIDYDALLDAQSTEEASATDNPALQSPLNDNAIADAATEPPEEGDYDTSFWGKEKLAAAMERRRKRLQPGKPQIYMEGGCGGGESAFSVALSPPDGRLWLINAFAFKVCERKRPDPWDHVACGWNEFASGDKSVFSGRYMYEARWPDGTVRRGAKVLEDTEEAGEIVIRRD